MELLNLFLEYEEDKVEILYFSVGFMQFLFEFTSWTIELFRIEVGLVVLQCGFVEEQSRRFHLDKVNDVMELRYELSIEYTMNLIFL